MPSFSNGLLLLPLFGPGMSCFILRAIVVDR